MRPAGRVHVVVQNGVGPGEVPKRLLPGAAQVRQWVRGVLTHEGRGGQVTVRMVGEAEGRTLNERYRGRAGATNVLSFPSGQSDEVAAPLLGDIVICAPVVLRESEAQGKTAAAHWAHLVTHGVLHLLGYDHQTERQAQEMESLETGLLTAWGYPDPYAGAPTSESIIG